MYVAIQKSEKLKKKVITIKNYKKQLLFSKNVVLEQLKVIKKYKKI